MLLVLPRLRRVFPLRQWCSRRTLSDAVPKYASKVRALPFAISQEDAVQRYMNRYANMTYLRKNQSSNVGESLRRLFFDSAIALKYVQAVYLPGWIVDAEVQTNAWLGKSAQQLTTVQLVDSYLPGYSFDVLSRISLNHDDIDASDAVPFSNDLMTQHGSQVLCLPYSISPLSLVEKLRSQPKRIVVNDDLKFDPAINLNFLAAYPILIPLYLARYEHESMSATIIFEASTCRTYFELFESSWLRSSWLCSKLVNHVHSNYWSKGTATPFSNIRMFPRRHCHLLHQWLDAMISQPGSAERLISGSPVDFTDNRVREFTKEETTKNHDFLAASSDVAEMEDMLKEEPGSTVVGININLSGIKKIGADALRRKFKSKIDRLHQKRDAMMPQWWKEASKS